MAKDPAFLFYSSDFLSGISDLTMEERGQYITLLCLQHQKGSLSEKTISLSVGSVSVDVLKKFTKDSEGNFFNKRLLDESEKRNKFTESRRINGLQGGRGKVKEANAKPKKKHKVKLMEDVNENEDVIINDTKSEINLMFPFNSLEFNSIWKVLLTQKKWKKKSYEALQASLEKLSKHSEQDAIQMIKNTIAGEWQGIFELKNNEKSTTTTGNRNSKQESVRELVELSKQVLGADDSFNG